MKGWILELTGQFDTVHSIKDLTQQIPELKLKIPPAEFINAITLIDEYQHPRYRNRKDAKDVNDERNVFLEIRAGTGGMRARCLPVIYSECIRALLNAKAKK